MRDARDHGTTGVVAAVATLLTGPRQNRISVNGRPESARRIGCSSAPPMTGFLAQRRRDSGRGVQLDPDMTRGGGGSEMASLFPKVIADIASAEEAQHFAALWQDRVRRMLIEHADDQALVRVSAWPASSTQ